jgi:uncharacterized RDD family membrane protein YckC
MPASHPDSEIWLTDGVLTRRVLAWLADMLLVGVLFAAVCVSFGVLSLVTFGLGLPLFWLLPVLPFAYHWLFIASAGATPGQALFGIRVRREDDFGPPSLVSALVFTVVLWVQLASSGLWLLSALFTFRNRAIHDLASGLVVVRSRALTQRSAGWTMPHA